VAQPAGTDHRRPQDPPARKNKKEMSMSAPQKVIESDQQASGDTMKAPDPSHQATRGTVVIFRYGSRLINPLTRRFSGSRVFPLYGLLRHRGRRSGRAFATPVVALSTADGFVIPMPFGQGTDWYRNVQAAGGCIIRWRGAEYPLVEPEVIDWATARSAFSPVLRAIVPIAGIQQFLRLRRAH
jgi:deazaflavin-dependent oxidoreductase (nitroreductase family)